MNNIVTQNDLNRQKYRFETMINVIKQFGYMINPSCTDPLIPIIKLDDIPEENEEIQNADTADLLKKMKRKNAWTKRPHQSLKENIYFGEQAPIPTKFVKSKMSKRRSRTKSESKRRNKRSRTKSDPVRPVRSISEIYKLVKNNSAPANIMRKSKIRSLRGGKRKSKKKKVRNMTKKTKK
jgi:hypothetical protein